MGSHINEAGQIYAYGQAWPVISGFATRERAKTALNSVERLLNTRNGIKLSTPGFNGYDPVKGGITTYPPGAKENCGIFLHVNPWVIIAETLQGNGERAYRYYSQINPAKKNEAIDRVRMRAVRLPAEYPQRRTPAVWPGAQLLAVGHGLMDVPGRHALPAWHPARIQRAARGPLHPNRMGRV